MPPPFPPLSPASERKIDELLGSMTLEERIGQLLCPALPKVSRLPRPLADVPLGGFFVMGRDGGQIAAFQKRLSRNTRVPLIVCSDLENGAGPAIPGQMEFAHAMGLAATGSPKLVREAARVTAAQGRANEVHWTLGPVCDINYNPANPVVNNRAFGDTPEVVGTMAEAFLRGIQDKRLMAATAKHFPGDGMDDRDQHLCTSINPLSRKDWMRTYGEVWRRVFDAGVLTVMTGHIALPWKDSSPSPFGGYRPATLSRRIQRELLRKELGFEGVLISDAIPMVGYSAHVRKGDEAVAFLRAGGDVVLFSNPVADLPRILEAVRSKEIREAQIDSSVERILRLKAALGLLDDNDFPPEQPKHREVITLAQNIADRACTIVRNNKRIIPLNLDRGAKVLTITIAHDIPWAIWYGGPDLPTIDQELTKRGFRVDHLRNPDHYAILKSIESYDAVFLNVKNRPHCQIGTLRLNASHAMTLWRAFWTENPKTIFTSFGNPYLIHELPHAPAMINMYSWTAEQQKAAVKVWLGEMRATGSSPVCLKPAAFLATRYQQTKRARL